MTLNVKKCTKCKANKPLGLFHNDKSQPSGKKLWCIDCVKTHRLANPEQDKAVQRRRRTKKAIWSKMRYNSVLNFKIANLLRGRLKDILRGQNKAGSAVKDLGCSVPELISHLESKFLPGMSWENHSLQGWHIDHVIPLSQFDLTDREQFLKANHYSNLQPLWAKNNLQKGSRLTNLSPNETI